MTVDKKNTVPVEIMGEEFMIKSVLPPERVRLIAGTVNLAMKEVAQNNSRLSKYQIAILAAMGLAERLSRLEKDRGGEEDELA